MEILKKNKLFMRNATNADSENIKEHIFGILETYGLFPDLEGVDSDLNDIESNYHNNNGFFYIVVDSDENILATTALFSENKYTCELRKMYLHKSLRGKGIGKFLLEYSIKKAKEMGFKKITLETASVLKEAIALYEKYGFKSYEGKTCDRCDQTYFFEI